MSNPFTKVKEAALGKEQPQSESEKADVAGEQPATEVTPKVESVVQKNLPPPQPPPKIKPSELAKKEAVAFVEKAFAAKEEVWVIALDKGEHPKGKWNQPGDRFKLLEAQAYSHRWMKLA